MNKGNVRIGPFEVVIDTETFIRSNYNYSGDLAILQKYVQDGVISSVIVSDITVREVIRNLTERYTALADSFKKLSENKDWRVIRDLPNYIHVFDGIDAEKMLNDAKNLFDRYLNSIHAKIVDSEGVSLEKVLDDYFNERPPFGKKEKKYEFPDAFMIEKIKSNLSLDAETFIVGNDDDWAKAFSDYKSVVVCKTLKDLFAKFTAGLEVSKIVYDFYKQHKDEINGKIATMFWELSYSVDGCEYDRKGVSGGFEYDGCELENVEVKTKFENVDYIAQDTIEATIRIKADLEFECHYLDESRSVWDSEDKAYLHMEYGYIKEIHNVERIITIVFDMDNEEVVDFDLSPCLYGPIELNQKTLIYRKAIDNDNEDWDEAPLAVSRIYKCPKCGREIKVNLMQEATFTSHNERSMGTEIGYAVNYEGICECRQEFNIQGELYEYPAGALNYDTTKISWK